MCSDDLNMSTLLTVWTARLRLLEYASKPQITAVWMFQGNSPPHTFHFKCTLTFSLYNLMALLDRCLPSTAQWNCISAAWALRGGRLNFLYAVCNMQRDLNSPLYIACPSLNVKSRHLFCKAVHQLSRVSTPAAAFPSFTPVNPSEWTHSAWDKPTLESPSRRAATHKWRCRGWKPPFKQASSTRMRVPFPSRRLVISS